MPRSRRIAAEPTDIVVSEKHADRAAYLADKIAKTGSPIDLGPWILSAIQQV